jgi:hypothetical protein
MAENVIRTNCSFSKEALDCMAELVKAMHAKNRSALLERLAFEKRAKLKGKR